MAKGPWSETEDERLIGAVRKYGGRWSQVSRVVASRNSDQCSSHWSQVLDPDINYCDWTAHEDDQLLHAVLSYGTNWTTIAASHSPKRTTLALKNRYSTIRLRHKNHETRKVSAGIKSSSSESRTGSIKKKKGKTIKGSEEYNNKGAEEDEEEVEDEDDDGDDDDDDDNDDTEDDDDDSHSLSNATTMADASTTRPKFPNECATIADGNGKPISTASGSWAGFNKSSNLFSTNFFQAGTGNPLEEHLINETPDQLTYLNPLYSNATPLNSREPFFDTMQDTSGMNTGTPFPFYGKLGLSLSTTNIVH
ncbi:hypothetical protein MMC17_009506 [Xylographa soralifera]|nr:hypothetical protein [Xylographa soralifera]